VSILFQRALLLAKLESTFRTDAQPNQTLKNIGPIDSTADVDDGAEEITFAAHGYTTGEGPVQLAVQSGALPTGLAENTDYWIIRVDANTFQIAASRADAIADTPVPIDLTAAVGTFTLQKVSSDALLVVEPDFSPDITILDRNNVKSAIGAEPGRTGRKIASISFQHEVRGSGSAGQGAGQDVRPAFGTLLRGCGMAETQYEGPATILDDAPIPINNPTGSFTFAKTTAYTETLPRVVVLTCVTPGGSGVAEFDVDSPAVGAPANPLQAAVDIDAATMTDATPFDLTVAGTPAQITPTVTANFQVGDTFVVHLAPAGFFYTPISDAFESLTLVLFYEELRFLVTGARGTWTASGEADAFAFFEFTFTGDFFDPTDATQPTDAIFEQTLPAQVELQNVRALGGDDFDPAAQDEFNLCIQSFEIDIANQVVARECTNDPNSLAGAIIVSRNPTASFNPEATPEGEHPFWGLLSSADRIVWGLRVGSEQGNVVDFQALHAQYTGISQANRNEIRAYDVTLRLAEASSAGNDEIRIVAA